MYASGFWRSALANKGVRWIAGGWVAFIAENIILSENREYLISQFGDSNYHAGYGLLSTLACSSIAYGYFKHGRGSGPLIKTPGSGRKAAAFVLQTLGLVGMSQLIPTVRSPFVSVPPSPHRPEAQQSQEKKPSFAVRCPMDFLSVPPHPHPPKYAILREVRLPGRTGTVFFSSF